MIRLNHSIDFSHSKRRAPRAAQAILIVAACLTHVEIRAQAGPSNPAHPDPYLFQDLGGQAGLNRLVADFADRLTRHPQSKALFTDVKMDRFRDKLTEQLCEVSGGPCKYSGDPMMEVHKGLQLSAADFNLTVEMLQASMDSAGLSFRVQNRLLAQLAPLHRDIVPAK